MAILGLDHIIYASPDLQVGIDEIKALTGVEPAVSGTHPGRGTRNALFSLSPDSYIEVLAPDPAQPAEALAGAASRIPEASRITTWAAKNDDLQAAIESAAKGGVDLGSVESGSRALPAGGELSWRVARGTMPGGGLVPFLLDWSSSTHPAPSLPSGCSLRYFRAEHPNAGQVKELLALLGVADLIEVSQGPEPRIMAGLSTPKGEVELR